MNEINLTARSINLAARTLKGRELTNYLKDGLHEATTQFQSCFDYPFNDAETYPEELINMANEAPTAMKENEPIGRRWHHGTMQNVLTILLDLLDE